MFQPFRLRGVTLRNRIFVTPMCQYIADDGHAVLWHFSHHGRFSLSGVGGAMVEATAITRDGRITPGCLGIYLDSHIDGLRRIVEIYHDQRIPVGIQIGHAGRKASAAVPLNGAAPLLMHESDDAWQAVAPSAIALTDGWPTPRELSGAEIGSLLEAFAQAALRAVKSGFDFIEIHGAHGYLINSFFSPISNKRDDHWGGTDLQNRMRFPLRVAEAIRDVIPESMPLFYRTSCVDGIDGGVTISETIALARELGKRGVDLIDCSSGGIIGPSGRALQRPSPGYLVPFAEQIRKAAGIPTMAVGLITEAQQANEIIANGSADLVAMGRKLLDDPNFPYHAAQAVGHSSPTSILPASYGFFLQRWKPD
ncbi:MAG: NADH:flavin oxidoreductase/NADH oxidase [Gammaproteobacteria bacterium]|nr:NADH:flavin oxidoreductase/NADH oxidase [Gammaproteobacteria bacterium]MDH4315990.1 NADH:flavin oxidoreductase/NADH oxidase [Gammaproteobacteria bacterium]